MPNNQTQKYDENQIQIVLAGANVQMAIALWRAKKWVTYSEMRDTLISLIRSGRGDEVELPQMQFIYFINTHLRQLTGLPLPDWLLFTKDFPWQEPRATRTWDTERHAAVWRETL